VPWNSRPGQQATYAAKNRDEFLAEMLTLFRQGEPLRHLSLFVLLFALRASI